MTITRYSAVGQTVATANIRENIYTVPAGKIVKIKFNTSTELATIPADLSYRENSFTYTVRGTLYERGGNYVFTSATTKGASFMVGDDVIFGTKSYNSSATYGYVWLRHDPSDPTILLAPINITAITASVKAKDIASDINFSVRKLENEFILLAGQSVSLISQTANDSWSVNFGYDFTVYEEIL